MEEGPSAVPVEVAAPVAAPPRALLRSGWGQMWLVSYVSLTTVGLWNALDTIGGIGTGDLAIARTSMTIMHGTSIVGGFFAGSAVNLCGFRRATLAGTAALCFFLATVFAVHYRGAPLALLCFGACACGVLIGWQIVSIAAVLIEYALETERARFIALNSAVLNFGGLLGSLISLALSSRAQPGDGLTLTNYAVILAVAFTSLPAAALVQPPAKVRRSDGSAPAGAPALGIRAEIAAFLRGLADWRLWLLVPMFMCVLWHEVVVANYFNVQFFDVTSRAMMSVYYYSARILVSFPFQWACEGRRGARAGLLFIALVCCIAFAAAAAVLGNAGGVRDADAPLAWASARGALFAPLFVAYGALATAATSFSLWLIGAVCGADAARTTRYVSMFRVGCAVSGFLSWFVSTHLSYPTQWALSSALWVIAIGCVAALARADRF